MREAIIAAAVRTSFGKRNGALKDVHPVDLSGQLLSSLAAQTGIDPNLVEDVIWGCVTQIGDQSSNVGRFAVLAAGWPEHVPGVTVNRACGSSQQALEFAAAGVISGRYDLVVAGGVEVMTRVPIGAARDFGGMPYGPAMLARYGNVTLNQGVSAEMIAEKWQLSRTELDEFSAQSHAKATAAIATGAFEGQIIPIDVDGTAFDTDEGVRTGTSVETLKNLKPSFKEGGVIHAGNSSQISDGASAVVVTTPERARELGLTPLVRLHSGVVVGDDPVMMLTGPIPATEKLLKRSGVTLAEIGVYEVNEAFASVPMAWLAETGADPARLNPLGGAIALGHPLGASGTGLMTRMIHYMIANDIQYGLQTMCEGGGTANATLVELWS
jgi:acetyl-CoA acyltransferase